MGDVTQVALTGARIAAPVAGMYMYGKAMASSPYAGMGMMPAMGMMPYAMGMMPGMGMGMGMTPYGMGMGAMPYGYGGMPYGGLNSFMHY